MKSTPPTGSLAGATSDSPQGKPAAKEKAPKAEIVQFEALRIDVDGDYLNIYEAGGGRLVRALAEDVERIKGEGKQLERVRIARGDFEVAA